VSGYLSEEYKLRTEADRMFRPLRTSGRELTGEKPYTYDEVYQAYKRKWLKTKDIRERDGWDMLEPSEYLYTHVEDLDIAYGEMLKYLDDTEITAPKRAEMDKDMSETGDEYKLDDSDDRDMVAGMDSEPEIEGLTELFGEEGDTPDEEVEAPEPIIDDSVIGKIKASVSVPEEFKFADDMTFYTMLRNIFRGKNILVTGPSGCGKSSLGKILAEITNKPFYSFNFGDTMNPSAKLLGDTKFNKEDGTWFKPSRFVGAITDNSGAFIMLDEITRDRTGDLANILMPVLDGQKTLALDESDDADVVTLNDNAFFYATANIGREYLGCAHDLDRAWKDRFCGGLYELEYLPQKKEQELVQIRVPQISEDNARRITEFAKKIRGLYKAEELNVAVSTRMCLTTAEFLVDGMSLIDALKHTVLPFYPVQGGDDTERVRVIQTIQSMGD
jgi:MoxR-like ATPase